MTIEAKLSLRCHQVLLSLLVLLANPTSAQTIYVLQQGGGAALAELDVASVPFDQAGILSLTFLNGAGQQLGLSDGLYPGTFDFVPNGPVMDDGNRGLESSNANTAFIVDTNPPAPFVNLALHFGGAPSGTLSNTDAITNFSDRVRVVSGDWKLRDANPPPVVTPPVINWHDPANWPTTVPNAVGDVATFGPSWPTTSVPVNIDRATTIGSLEINNRFVSRITGPGPLVFDVPGSLGTARLELGDVAPSVSVEPELRIPDDNLSIRAARSRLTLAGPITSAMGDVVKTGPATLELAADNSSWGGTLFVEEGAVSVDHVRALGNSTGSTVLNGGRLEVTSRGSLVGSGNIVVNTPSRLTIQRPAGNDPALHSVSPSSVELRGGILAATDNIPFNNLLAPSSTGGTLILQSVRNFDGGGSNRLDFGALPGGDALRLGSFDTSEVAATVTMLPPTSDHTLKFGGGAGGPLLLRNAIADTGGNSTNVEQAVSGTTVLVGANSYTGFTAVRGGILVVDESGGLGNTSRIVLGGGELWQFREPNFSVPLEIETDGGTIVGDSVTLTGGATGTGNLVLVGNQSGLTIDGSPLDHRGDLTLSGQFVSLNQPNTYTGQTFVQGTVLINSADALGTRDTGTRIEGNGQLILNEMPNEDIELAGGELDIANTSVPYLGTVTLSSGAVGGAGTTTGRVVLTGEGPTLGLPQIIRGGTFEGPIEGSGKLDLLSEQFPINFDAANTYTGLTELHRGVLNLNHSSGLGTTDSGTIVYGGSLNVNVPTDEPLTLEGFGSVNLNAATGHLPIPTESADGFISVNVPDAFADRIALGNATLQINADVSVGGIMVNGRSGRIFVSPGNTLTVESEELVMEQGSLIGRIRGPSIIRKVTPGTAALSDLQDFDGEIVVERGTLDVLDNGGLGSAAGATTVTAGQNASLRLSRGGLRIEDDIRLNNSSGFQRTGGLTAIHSSQFDPAVIAGSVDLGAVGSYIGGDRVDSDAFLEIHGPVLGGALTKVGPGMRLTLANDSNMYSGATDIRQGSLGVSGEGRISTSSEIVIGNAGSLIIDNLHSANLTDRVDDSIPITLNGGTITLRNPVDALSTEVLGPVTLSQGHSRIESYESDPRDELESRLELRSITRRPGTTVSFVAEDNLQIRVNIPSTLENGILGGWAVVPSNSLQATRFATDGPLGIQPLRDHASNINTAGPTANVLAEVGTVLTADRTINSLTGAIDTDTIDLNGFTLNLASGGLLSARNNIINGKLTAGGARQGEAELFVHGGGLIEAAIVDNGRNPVSLVASDTINLQLSGNNSYSGSTTLNDATVLLLTETGLPAMSDVTLDGGTLDVRYISDVPLQLGTLTLRGGAQLNGFLGRAAFEFTGLDLQSGRIESVELTGSAPLRKSSDDIVTLRTNNPRYSGEVQIDAGILDIHLNDSLGAGRVVIRGGQLANRSSNSVTISNDIQLAGGDLVVGGDPNNASGQLFVTGTIEVGQSARVAAHDAGILGISGLIQSAAADAILHIDAGAIDNVNLEPSINVADGQSLTILADASPVQLLVSGFDKSVSGNGSVGNETTVSEGAVIQPGASTGSLQFQSDLRLGPQSVYEWEINNAVGQAGGTEGWDLLQVDGTLHIDSTAADPTRITILGQDTTGRPNAVQNFNAQRAYQWLIASASSVEGFDTEAFEIDASSFVNNNPITDDGQFFLRQIRDGLVVRYDPLGRDLVPLMPGDANQDLLFDQLDLVKVLVAGKYLTGRPATWGEGDWNAGPGGSQGSPPAGDGRFNQLDIVAALSANVYLTGPYAALRTGGQIGDAQTSVVYHANSGEIVVDPPLGSALTSINIDSAAAIFTGQVAANLGGSFDDDSDANIFKATFGGGFGSVSFGNVAQPGLSEEFVLNDLTVVGSLAGGGDLGNVDLVYVPESASVVLLSVGLAIGLVHVRRVNLSDSKEH